MSTKLLERVQNYYDWCKGGAGYLSQHYRLIVGKTEDGQPLCGECARLLLTKGYAYKPQGNGKLNTKPSKPTKERVLPQPKPKERVEDALRRRVLDSLAEGEGKVYTKHALISLARDITPSLQCLEILLADMRAKCEVIGLRLPAGGQFVYTLPDRTYLVKQRLGLSHETDLLRLLEGTGEELTIEQLSQQLGRAKSTIKNWVEILEKIGAIASEVRKAFNKPGRIKVFWREARHMDSLTKKLVDDLEARTDKAAIPLYGQVLQRARQGYYNDFKSPIATPITALVNDLVALGLYDLVEKARKGDYDATEEEANAWMQAEGKDLL